MADSERCANRGSEPQMSSSRPSELGDCPNCGTTITGIDVLVEYETADGDMAVWADCPGCGDVVDPEAE